MFKTVTNAAEVVEACGSQPVCRFDGGSISNADELSGVLPEGVRVVVIPRPDQAESMPTGSLASQFKSMTGADTVIVVEDHPGSDRFAVASNDDAAAITEALYSQGESDGGVAIAAISQTLESAPPSTESGADVGGGALISIALAAAVIAAAGGVIFAVVRRRAKRAGSRLSDRQVEKRLAQALNGEDGERVRKAIEELGERARAYPEIGQSLSTLQHHVSELFVRVRGRGTDQQARLLQSQYKDTLSKLLKALGDDYYGDISRNPQFWSNPEHRLDEVRRAVVSVDAQAVENVRQVNESRDLEFQVALDSLTRTVDEAKLSDVYSDREK